MKGLLSVFAVLFMTSFAFAGFQGFNEGASLEVFDGIRCAQGVTCLKEKGVMKITGMVKVEAAVAGAIPASKCGYTLYNTAATAVNLPEASTVIGCTITFVTLNASNFDINPDNADIILLLGSAAGDAIRNATLGNIVVLQAVSASQWVNLGAVGTYTDIN